MIVIPAIDIMDGKCVRLLKGRFDSPTSYSKDPMAMARAFEDEGITNLHLVDLDGAREGKPSNLATLRDIAGKTSLKIDFGGGVRSPELIERVLESGADKVNLGTFLFSSPQLPGELAERFGTEKLIAAIDIDNGMVSLRGWQERSVIPAEKAFEDLLKQGWKYFSVTDISRDGTMQGADPEFYRPLAESFPEAKITGGGGVATVEDLIKLKSCGLYAAITGKAVFEGTLSLKDIAAINNK